MAAPAVIILNVDPGGNGPGVANGPWLSAAGFWAIARMAPVDGWITTIIACLPTLFTARCAAFCIERSSVSETDGAGVPGTSLRIPTSTPFWLTLTPRHTAL